MKPATKNAMTVTAQLPVEREPVGSAAQAQMDEHVRPRAQTVQEPLRILHVFNAVRRAGTEMGVLKVTAGLSDQRFDHRLCTMWGYDQDFLELHGLEGKVSVAGHSDWQRRKLSRHHLHKLIGIMRQHRPHIVHTRNWSTVEAIVAARLTGVPVVIHSEHGHNADTTLDMPLRRRIMRRCLYAMSDAVFTVSQELRDFHARAAWVAAERIRVIYNGVDLDRFAPRPELQQAARARHGLPAGAFIVGYIGRIELGKDIPTLFDAAKELLRRGRNLHVVTVGEGFLLKKFLEEIPQTRELRGRVTFTGATDDVPQLLNAMDAFVLPSLGEGLSNTLLEAMASGLPVVVTRVGGNPEVVEDGRSGLLFMPRDAAALAEHLDCLIKDGELRARLGRTARERVVKQFSLKTMMESYRNLYLEAAGRRGLRAGR